MSEYFEDENTNFMNALTLNRPDIFEGFVKNRSINHTVVEQHL